MGDSRPRHNSTSHDHAEGTIRTSGKQMRTLRHDIGNLDQDGNLGPLLRETLEDQPTQHRAGQRMTVIGRRNVFVPPVRGLARVRL